MIEVITASEGDQGRWNCYLASKGIFHHAYYWPWREIFNQTFGHEPVHLIAQHADPDSSGVRKVIGVLPLFFMKSVLFGKSLISVPYLNAGGIVADSAEAFGALLDRADDIARELEVEYVELRHREPLQFKPVSSTTGELKVRSHKTAMVLPLPPDPEQLFASFPPKLRSQIRRPAKSGVYAEVSAENLDLQASLNAFYSVFSEHMRDLGTPVYPRKLFANTLAAFSRADGASNKGTAVLEETPRFRTRVITVWHENRPVAGGIALTVGEYTEIPWASALKRHNKLSPNMMLYWQTIKTAALDGARIFDFGRSSVGTGTYKFKEQWGAKPIPLHWYYSMHKGELPDVNPQSARFSLLSNCWRRLPLGIANTLGPWITKSLP